MLFSFWGLPLPSPPLLLELRCQEETTHESSYILRQFAAQSYELHTYVTNHDGKKFTALHQQFKNTLLECSPAEEHWPALMSQNGLDMQTVFGQHFKKSLQSAKWPVFPKLLHEAVQQAVGAFEQKYSDQYAAAKKSQQPLEAVVGHVVAKLLPSKPLGEALALFVAAQDAEPTTVDMPAWKDKVLANERRESKFSNAEVKLIIAKLNVHFSTVMVDAEQKTNLELEGFSSTDLVQKKMKLVRVGALATRSQL